MCNYVSRRTVLALGAVAAGEVLLGEALGGAPSRRRVVVWSEGTAPKTVYPKDINTAVAEGLAPLRGWQIVTATLADPEQGVAEESLQATDVLIWWGHKLHGQVTDEHMARIVRHVKEDGMGFIALHSSHFAKPLRKLLGTNCGWQGGYVEDGSKLELIVKDKGHPIVEGVSDFVLPKTERYGEPFEVPAPESLVLDGIYTRPDGVKEQSRQGLVWTVGKGKVFYFQPGHETYPIFFDENVRKVLRNAVVWMAKKG
ncbi:MAG: ThuA domain-containing protein [Thermoguttaceae bacterium]